MTSISSSARSSACTSIEASIVDGRVDTAALRPVARCGYLGEYAVVDELFEMLRPDERRCAGHNRAGLSQYRR